MLMGLMLGLFWGMVVESSKGFFDVAGHAEVNSSSFVVPIEG